MRRYSLLAATLTLGACTVQKTGSSAAKDSVQATVPVPTQTPAPATVAPSPTATDETNKSAPAKAKTRTAGGERDSAVQAVFEIGPDGKLRRVKR
jgi:hypothetical protein